MKQFVNEQDSLYKKKKQTLNENSGSHHMRLARKCVGGQKPLKPKQMVENLQVTSRHQLHCPLRNNLHRCHLVPL